MAFKATTRQFDGVVYASDIKPSECMLDYINGKGQFYIENKYYPVVKFTYDEKNKEPFVKDEYPNDTGISVKTPRILYNFGGKWYRKFSVVWNVNAANSNKQFFCLNTYNCWDKDKKTAIKSKPSDGKIRVFEIPITSMNEFDDSPDDQALALFSFHITEVFAFLTYAYIFDINLADDAFKACKDNLSLYETFAKQVNQKLDGVAEVMIDDEVIERYNDIPFYIKDPEDEDVTAMQIPAYYDGEKYKTLPTLQNFISEAVFTASARGPKLIDGVAEKLSDRKANIIKVIGKKAGVGNRIMLRIGAKEGEEPKKNFTVKGQFRFLNTTNKEDREKCAGLCTAIFDKTKKLWVPIDSEEFLMRHYRQKLSGDIYMSFEFKLGTTGKGTFGMKPRIDMFDVKVVPREAVSVNGATLRALRRIEVDEKIDAKIEAAQPPADGDGDADAEYNVISEEDMM